MKKILFVLIMLAVMAYSIPAFSVGFETYGIGTKAMGMGGAFIGVADDWTACFWNPGGLTQLKGRGVGTYLYTPVFKQGDSTSVKNFDLANYSLDQGDMFMRIYPTEPAKFNVTSAEGHSIIPGVGYHMNLSSKSTLAMAFYVPIGLSTNWSDTAQDSTTGASIPASYQANIDVLVTNFSYAQRIKEGLSLGVGINFTYGRTKINASKSYNCAAVPTLNYTFTSSATGSGLGYEGIIGLMFNPSPQFSLGIVYKTGTVINMNGTASAVHDLAGYNESSAYTQKFPIPAHYGLGIAIRPTPRTTFSFDIKRSNWAGMANIITYVTPGVALTNVDSKADWRDTMSYRFGLDHKLNNGLSLRGGFMYEPYAVPDKGIGITGVNDVSFKYICLGIGYSKGNNTVDFAIERVFGGRTTAAGDTYSIVMTDYNIGYRRSF